MLFSQRLSFLLTLLALAEGFAYASVNVALHKSDTVSKCIREDERSGHSVIPNCREVVERAGRKSEMAFNSLGLRDKDYPPVPKPGWTRILLVGSSAFVAPGLAEKNSPARLLEAKLRKLNPKVEVINASVEGYSTYHILTKIRDWTQAYSPTVTILNINISSFNQADLLYAPYLMHQGDSTILNMDVKPWMRPIAWIFGWNKDYPGKRAALTWQSFLHRFYVTTKCRLTEKRGRPMSLCLIRSSAKAVSAVRNIMEAGGSKFVATFNQGSYMNRVNLSPAFDENVALKVDSFTPGILITDSDFAFILSQMNVRYETMRKFDSPGLTLEGDYHLNEAGSNFIAEDLAKIAAREAGLASKSKPRKP